ncbi:MAG TPA: DoxX family protein, partial [Intrasporangium sp.]|nr:DoxX family protein [Intrasporangium sp.]
MSQYVADRPGRQIRLPRPALATVVGQLHGVLERYSISLLRISLGLVFLGFGIVKFFPGLSPAEDIAAATIERLTFGYIAGDHAVLMTAIVETFI